VSRGSRYRCPRRFKKAWQAHLAGRATPKQLTLLARALVFPSLGGWKRVRRHNSHVAMGDTSAARARASDWP